MKKFSLTFKITAIVLISFLVILSFEAYQGYNRYKNAAIKEKLIDNEYVDVIKNAIYNAAIDHKDLTIDQLKNEIINDTNEESKSFYALYKDYDEDELEEYRNNTKEQYILIADKDGNLINASGMSDIFFIHDLDYIGLLNDNNDIYVNINAKDIPRIVKTISDNWDNGLNVKVSTTNFEMTNDNIRIIDNPAYLKIGNEVIIDGAYKDIETIFIDHISSFFYKLEKNKPIDNYFLYSYPFFEKKVASKVTNTYEEGSYEQDNTTVVYSYAAIEDNNYQPFGYILKVGLYPDLNKNVFIDYLNDNIYSYLLSVLFVILISVVASKIITKPIKLIEQSTKEITKGNFDHYLKINSKDELGSLAHNINIMNNTIKNNIDDLNKNIIKIKKLENIRKEFIANFTHEIKTPLSIINGYSELIEDCDDNTKKERYLSIINEQTEKINQLVLAMLELSKLESNHIKLDLEEFNLNELVTTIIDNLTYLLKIKNIKVDFYSDDSTITADKFKIEMVVKNYLTNAIKHTNNHGIIKVIIKNKTLYVENMGKHISEDKLENIWLSFIKDDRDGTGLGLAICKAILDLHHFKYGVENIENGVRFYFQA
ncbi:sensor histidine kinase [Thomasclavelia saccharogumia]|uniref:sensor histidine kinase n=1 Tax=Thomasclavelia saccharogumia TaxID=341225 RepID=UPI00047E7971|nr:HAMP domain-containing sensor histidine kinase [Thomasclavelia saccharogumia]